MTTDQAQDSTRAWATLNGSVSYRQRIALRPGLTVTVQLQDVSRADAPADVLATATMVTRGGQPPVPFTLTYDSAAIDDRHSYSVRATIHQGEKLVWTSTTVNPVLTRGAPVDNVVISVQQVPSS